MVTKVALKTNYHHPAMHFIMSQKEVDRHHIIQRRINEEIGGKDAAKLLKISTRHLRRLVKGFKGEGVKALIHKNRGKESNFKMPKETKKKIVKLLHEIYSDFNPGHACEKLEEVHGISYCSETIRQIMIEENLWRIRARKRDKYHSKRIPKEYFGEMIQFDGSYHDWFEGREEKCCLLSAVDDATSTITHAKFVRNENLEDIFSFFKEYFLSRGKPRSIYLDKLMMYHNNLREENLTQFQRAAKELGIDPIPAGSAEAKGRVERPFKTLQDRLVKEMRLKGVSDKNNANEYLKKEFLSWYNKRYGKAPVKKVNLHQSLTEKENNSLMSILSKKEERVVHNDFVIYYEKRFFQFSKKQPVTVKKKDKVIVEKRMDKTICFRLREKYLNYQEISSKKRESISTKDIPWILPANTKVENEKVEN